MLISTHKWMPVTHSAVTHSANGRPLLSTPIHTLPQTTCTHKNILPRTQVATLSKRASDAETEASVAAAARREAEAAADAARTSLAACQQASTLASDYIEPLAAA